MKDERLLALGGLKQRGLLALLLLDRNRVVPRDRVIDALLGERPPASAANSVQVYVSKLRRLLGDGGRRGEELLVTQAPGYMLKVPAGSLDADEFERLLANGTAAFAAGDFTGAGPTLADAVENGPPSRRLNTAPPLLSGQRP